MKLRLIPQATQDLHDIRAYLVPHSSSGAEHVRLAIESTIDLLALFPGIARNTDIEDVRVILVTSYPYLVYHRLTKKEVVVIHVRHSSRDFPTSSELERQ
ncbi:hypothetical protein A3A40_01740 [Candidatus Kaiserbacteria bacterium RIFCSPLOWO2_01_FULL_54_20]|uniref:Plasmid stabilization protein n=1 Tax=Candidatus Kaiserbacteria bacterium RIFCSPLOWO2_01_FULL_54_20 TaxID=1798513 RepID=A0A1F6EL14_9BACT|nr:MAG: hypothetical protein A3A40_01740 [Candidatus Kaiserbacteria bacterium RIFCSPLOWO2_01_FULL_54_20]